MKTIPELMKEIEEAESLASIDVEAGDPRAAVGRGTLKRQGEARLEAAKEELKGVVKSAATYIAPNASAEAAEAFATSAEEEAGAVTVVATELYERLANAFYPSMGKAEEFTPMQEGLLYGELRNVMQELDIASMPMVATAEGRAITSFEDAVSLARQQVRKAMGDRLNCTYIESKVVESVMKTRYNGVGVPVTLLGATADEIAGFEGEGGWTIYSPKVPEVISPEATVKILGGIAKKVKEAKK